jgi:hypothetical protein
MARSEEERRRIWEEEENEPYLPGLTWGQFKALSPRQRSHELQKFTQRVTSYMGFWKTCNLSPCRRARACKGFLTEAQYSGEPRWHDAFPPCVGPKGARQPEVLACMDRISGAQEDDGPKYDGRWDADGVREW